MWVIFKNGENDYQIGYWVGEVFYVTYTTTIEKEAMRLVHYLNGGDDKYFKE